MNEGSSLIQCNIHDVRVPAGNSRYTRFDAEPKYATGGMQSGGREPDVLGSRSSTAFSTVSNQESAGLHLRFGVGIFMGRKGAT